jgi:hypothetical protein
MPAQRGVLAVLLAGVLVTGVVAALVRSGACGGSRNQCSADGIVRWSQPLGGSWIAQNGVEGTVYGHGQAAAAAGNGVAVIGFGLTVSAYDVTTGFPRWTERLTGLPPGSAIASVLPWRRVLTVGVSSPGSGSAGVIVLSSVTGKHIRTYRAGDGGGAVQAGLRRTVIVGPTSVTSYVNATGRAVWRDPAGPAGQAWRVLRRKLYVTVSAGGVVGTAPVTAVRQIDLQTGMKRLIRPHGRSFSGMLTGVIGGELVFSSSSGLSMYSVANGHLTGYRPRAVTEWADPVQNVLYANIAGVLTGIDPATARNKPDEGAAIPAGAFGVRAGVALGLNPGDQGAAWGYSLAKRRVIWTAKALPYPHYFFAESSGLGGSADRGSGMVLLVTCGATGQPVRGTVVGGGGRTCLRPRLAAIGPWGARS